MYVARSESSALCATRSRRHRSRAGESKSCERACNLDRHTFDGHDISAPFAGSRRSVTVISCISKAGLVSRRAESEREKNENNPMRISRVGSRRGGVERVEVRRDETLLEFRYNVNGSHLFKEAPPRVRPSSRQKVSRTMCGLRSPRQYISKVRYSRHGV